MSKTPKSGLIAAIPHRFLSYMMAAYNLHVDHWSCHFSCVSLFGVPHSWLIDLFNFIEHKRQECKTKEKTHSSLKGSLGECKEAKLESQESSLFFGSCCCFCCCWVCVCVTGPGQEGMHNTKPKGTPRNEEMCPDSWKPLRRAYPKNVLKTLALSNKERSKISDAF